MSRVRPLKKDSQKKQGEPISLDPVPFEEAVADRLKVKKPEGKAKPKKARSRERKKRNVGPFE
jgi:hypothetical protein